MTDRGAHVSSRFLAAVLKSSRTSCRAVHGSCQSIGAPQRRQPVSRKFSSSLTTSNSAKTFATAMDYFLEIVNLSRTTLQSYCIIKLLIKVYGVF
jgi:hypothetical protein